MSRRRVTIVVDGRVIVVRGWQVKALLTEAGLRGIYSGRSGGWVLDTKRLPDLVAYLEYRNITPTITDQAGDAA